MSSAETLVQSEFDQFCQSCQIYQMYQLYRFKTPHFLAATIPVLPVIATTPSLKARPWREGIER